MAGFNPFDPLGAGKAMAEQLERMQSQAQEAVRQARLNVAKTDVTAAYTAWVSQPDGPASENLKGAVAAYLTALEE